VTETAVHKNKRELSLAPMEGITGYIFRNAVHDIFGDSFTRYYSPFISPRPRVGLQAKEIRDILPENNKGICLIPQLLSANASELLSLAAKLHGEFGYGEFNINCGCPSKTVVSHGRGAGLLKDPDALDRFLDEVFSRSDLKFSVKTRMGILDPQEAEELLKIYEKYPLTELIVHARVLNDYYKLPARKEAFFRLVRSCRLPVVYNGDIFSVRDYLDITESSDMLSGIMLGRGAVTDPALGRAIMEADGNDPAEDGVTSQAGEGSPSGNASPQEYRRFHDQIFSSYGEIFDGPTPLLFHMKELWGYMGARYPGKEKVLKRLRKAKDIASYLSAVNEIFG